MVAIRYCAIDILLLSILFEQDESKSKKGLAELYEVRIVIIFFISKQIVIKISIKSVNSFFHSSRMIMHKKQALHLPLYLFQMN